MDDSASSSSGFQSADGDGMTVEACQNMIQRSLRTPMVKFLMDQMEKSGCGIGSNFIRAVHCEEVAAGGYLKGEGIVICSNRTEVQDEVTQVVIHELIHAYDECRAANLDWSNCAHHACSEIRAGHLSGDCHYKRELLRGYLKIKGHEQGLLGHTCSCRWDDQVLLLFFPLPRKECVLNSNISSVHGAVYLACI